MELLPKKKPVGIKLIYIGILFLFIFSGVLGLYGYLWNMLRIGVARTVAIDFYLEGREGVCTSNAECANACGRLSNDEACICLKNSCHYLKGLEHFSQSKFCEQDTDCVVSCFEGPVNKAYYERAGGYQEDCMDGCRELKVGLPEARIPVCHKRQCQFADGSTCFIKSIPSAAL